VHRRRVSAWRERERGALGGDARARDVLGARASRARERTRRWRNTDERCTHSLRGVVAYTCSLLGCTDSGGLLHVHVVSCAHALSVLLAGRARAVAPRARACASRRFWRSITLSIVRRAACSVRLSSAFPALTERVRVRWSWCRPPLFARLSRNSRKGGGPVQPLTAGTPATVY
jgi:hypothetical protein